jgi:catechol 2,3-dioxygenase-like lactoylglutathione lyase family enzyme
MPDAKVHYSTPMYFVMDIARTIRFYELLGFRVIDTQSGAHGIVWARMHCESGSVMFLQASHPPDASQQAVIFALYTRDLPTLRELLLANGIEPERIEYPEHMPSGSMRVDDPDGFNISINQWGEAEQAKWEQHLRDRPPVRR